MSDVYGTVVNYTIFFNPANNQPLGLTAGFYDSAGWHYAAPFNVVQGVWSHVAATYDGTTIRLYVDGTLVSSLAYAATPASNGVGFRIGRRWDSASMFAGRIEDAAVYSSALSQTRIAAHHNAGQPAPTVAYLYPKVINNDMPASSCRRGDARTLAGSAPT